MTNDTYSGRCLCENISFRVTGPAINVRVCHCRECQKAMAGPYFARALFAKDDIIINGDVRRYATSADLDRIYCADCGTTFGAQRRSNQTTGIAAALFDDPNIFVPTDHIWLSEKTEAALVPADVGCHQKGMK